MSALCQEFWRLAGDRQAKLKLSQFAYLFFYHSFHFKHSQTLTNSQSLIASHMLWTRTVCIHVTCTDMLGNVCVSTYVSLYACACSLMAPIYVCVHTNVHRYACAILRASLTPQIPLTSLYSQQCYHYSLALPLPTHTHTHAYTHSALAATNQIKLEM